MSLFERLSGIPRKFWYICANYCGLLYVFGTIFLVFFVNVYFTCPALEGDRCSTYVAIGLFFILEIMVNFFCFHWYSKYNRVDVIFPESALPAGIIRADGTTEIRGDPETTKFCFNCRRSVPIRSHHCPLCNYCVLKKDHHCFLTAGCVGFGNQRYFVVFLFWAAVGSLYGAYFTGQYLNKFYKPFFPLGFIDYIFPFAIKKWLLFQHCTAIDLAYIMVFSAGFGGGLAAMAFFVFQLRLILKGQTMYEMNKKDEASMYPKRMPMGLKLQCVFGPYWLANFLIPMPYRNRLDESFKKLLYESHLKEM